MIPVRPAIVSATYGQCRISDVHDDPIAAVVGHYEDGATTIRVDWLLDKYLTSVRP